MRLSVTKPAGPPAQSAGFSLVELMVTIAIVVIVTAVVIVRYSGFNSSVLLRSQAFEVALDLREAQVLAVSVQGQSGGFRNNYGVHFNTTDTGQYLLFQDVNDNQQYDSGGDNIVETRLLDPRYRISSLCAEFSGNTATGTCQINHLDIMFKRPNFDALYYVAEGSTVHNPSTILDGQVWLVSLSDPSIGRGVYTYSTGQIVVY